jgi:hypothetical protein
VLLKGRHQRYCQQCGRFHPLAAFDDDRRSCRAGLARHNARRRSRATTRKSDGGRGNSSDDSWRASTSHENDEEDADTEMGNNEACSSGGGTAERRPAARRPPAKRPSRQRLAPAAKPAPTPAPAAAGPAASAADTATAPPPPLFAFDAGSAAHAAPPQLLPPAFAPPPPAAAPAPALAPACHALGAAAGAFGQLQLSQALGPEPRRAAQMELLQLQQQQVMLLMQQVEILRGQLDREPSARGAPASSGGSGGQAQQAAPPPLAPPLAPPPLPAPLGGGGPPAGYLPQRGDVATATTALHRLVQVSVVRAIEGGRSGCAAALRALDPSQQVAFLDEVAAALVQGLQGMPLAAAGSPPAPAPPAPAPPAPPAAAPMEAEGPAGIDEFDDLLDALLVGTGVHPLQPPGSEPLGTPQPAASAAAAAPPLPAASGAAAWQPLLGAGGLWGATSAPAAVAPLLGGQGARAPPRWRAPGVRAGHAAGFPSAPATLNLMPSLSRIRPRRRPHARRRHARHAPGRVAARALAATGLLSRRAPAAAVAQGGARGQSCSKV